MMYVGSWSWIHGVKLSRESALPKQIFQEAKSFLKTGPAKNQVKVS
jgi:hypothetical protein